MVLKEEQKTGLEDRQKTGKLQPGSPRIFFASKMPPEEPFGLAKLVLEMNESRTIRPGHITPKMLNSLCKKLNAHMSIYDPETLCRLILGYCGFDYQGFDYSRLFTERISVKRMLDEIRVKNIRGEEFKNYVRLIEYHMQLQAFQNAHLTYNGEKRESGNDWISHPLRAGLFVAALGAPQKMVISAILHDSLEDPADPDLLNVKFRAYDEKLNLVVLEKESEILEHVKENYWRYGPAIAKDMQHDTLKRRIGVTYWKNPERYTFDYQEHLRMAHTRIGSAFAKAGDAIANINEISPIADKIMRERKLRSRILKLDWQIPYWKQIEWQVFEILVYNLMINSEDEKIWEKHRFVTARELCGFQDGYNITGLPHMYTQALRDRVMPSRSPVIEIYSARPQSKGASRAFIFEYPFLRDASAGISMLKEAFSSKLVGEPKEIESLLPEKSVDAKLVRAEFTESPEIGLLNALVRMYDEEIRQIVRVKGNGEELDFDRVLLTQAGWERHHRMKNELKL